MGVAGDDAVKGVLETPPFVIMALWQERGTWKIGSTTVSREDEAHDAATLVKSIPGCRVFFVDVYPEGGGPAKIDEYQESSE